MLKFTHPTEFSGKHPDGWGGYTWLDFDGQANSFHPGDDYNWGNTGNADLGKPVWAITDGKVVYSGDDTVLYGKMIVIEHTLDAETRKFIKDNYRMDVAVLYSLYAHLLERYVAIGNRVNSASLIGRVGKSGVTYAHLHTELYRGDLDLKDKPWRFYPIGWKKELIVRNWLPVYSLIEKAKAYQPAPPVDQYVVEFTKLKIDIDRLKAETDGLNSSADKKAAYNSTMEKVKKIAAGGHL